MISNRNQRLKSWINKWRRREMTQGATAVERLPASFIELENPAENYYKHLCQTNLPVFYRFALQTRSIEIRDFFAKSASDYALDLSDLLTMIGNEMLKEFSDLRREFLARSFDRAILLTLADLLANTARDDLDTHSAVKIYGFIRAIHGDHAFNDKNKLQYVEALNELEYYADAMELADSFNLNDLAPYQQDLLELQRLRRTAKVPQEWLVKLNEFYGQLDMSKVHFLDNESLPLLDRLTAVNPKRIDGPRISVIMPTFSPGPGIRTAIRGLLDQSWQNIEIIVINDASPPEFRSIFDEIEGFDTRIRVLHQYENSGAYVARNAGLAIATGDFITTHDDDDWSHPDKLAEQIQVMLDNTEIVATTSGHIRVTEELVFRRVNMRAQFLQMNYSSLMFRKAVIEEIGPWDTVRRGGDSEFFTRIIENYGNDRVENLYDKPLSFSRVWDGSLTSGEMSRGYFGYSRLLYRWAFRQWHWSSGKLGQKATRTPGDVRPYAVPTSFETGERKRPLSNFDVIYVTDFFRQAKHVERAVEEIVTLSESGLRVGYMHLYSPKTIAPAGLPPRLLELQVTGKITQVGNEDAATAKLLLVHDLAIGMFVDQLSSKIESKRSVVVDHMLPSLTGSERRTPTIYTQALRNFDRFFNTHVELVGSSVEKHYQLRGAVPRSRLLSDNFIWNPHVTGKPSEIVPPEGKPTVGFHSYGNQYRWPNNSDTFRKVYRGENFTTKLFGQLEVAFKKFGDECFEEIEVVELGEQSETEFLNVIDFWVYFPHYRLEDQVWEPVLSAMQAGKVVILPKRLERLYGRAAVYTEPSEIATVVQDFASMPDKYTEQARQGQNLVASLYSTMQLVGRVKSLINPLTK